LPPGHLTPLLQEWLVHLGTEVPFRHVPRLLALFAGVRVSRETARRQTEAAGALLLAAETAAAPALAPPADPGPDHAGRLQVSADGAMVRVRHGEWVEVKTVAVGVVTTRPTADGSRQVQTTALSYFSRHAPVEEFTRQAVVELHRRGVRAAAAVVGVADGAAWVQGFLDYHRPDAVRILDLPHAAAHLGALAAAVWGENSAAARTWQAEQVRTLREHGPAAVLAAVTVLQAADPTNEALAEEAAYLQRRAAQLEYPDFRAAGWPIGSGVVESANKLVVEVRLKGAGMSWSRGALNPLLSLRNAVCNDRWAEAWATICAGQAAARAAQRQRQAGHPVAERAAAPGSAAAPPGVNQTVVAEGEAILERIAAELEQSRAGAAPVNGKPGPRHPWRHSPLRQRPAQAAS
jgi:hypothetical protein